MKPITPLEVLHSEILDTVAIARVDDVPIATMVQDAYVDKRLEHAHEIVARVNLFDELVSALDRAYTDAIRFLNEGDFKRHVVWDAGYIVDVLAKAKPRAVEHGRPEDVA